jgi:hypothetical protein
MFSIMRVALYAMSVSVAVVSPVTLAQPDSSVAPPTLRVIPKTYVSPGASGSIDSSQQSQQYDLYNGQRLPNAVRREDNYSGSQRIETRGGLRQSIEYPNGQRIELSPGSSSEQRQSR